MKKLHHALLLLLDETKANKVLDLISEWVKSQRACAMIFQPDGLSVHLVSKRAMIDDLEDCMEKSSVYQQEKQGVRE